jgi:multiple sugar transport system permease protein
MAERNIIPYLFILPCLAILVTMVAFPLVYSTWISFTNLSLFTPNQYKFVGLSNYAYFLVGGGSGPFWTVILPVTAVFIGGQIALQFLLGLGLAILASSPYVRGHAFIKTAFTAPILIPPVIVGYIWLYMYLPSSGLITNVIRWLGGPLVNFLGSTTNALPSLIIAETWQWTPFIFLILLAGIGGVRRDLIDAAETDGVTGYQKFRYIILPSIKPVIIVALLFRTLDAFRYLDITQVLTGGGPGGATRFLTFDIFIHAFKGYEEGLASSESYLLLIMVNILVIILVRSWNNLRKTG